MVYTSKKRSFKDFIKSRNNFFYVAIFLIFAAVIAIVTVTVSKNRNSHNEIYGTGSMDTINESPLESHEETTYIDTNGLYYININKNNCIITINNYDDEKIVRKMLCSISEKYKEGTYESDGKDSARLTWYETEDKTYRYYTDFGNEIVFHSAGYHEKLNKNSLITDEYMQIGTVGSMEGITLNTEDAKWIFEHCSSKSIVRIYNDTDEEADISGMALIQIPDGITWDPTDDSEGSPWSSSLLKSLDCPETIILEAGTDIKNIRKYYSAYDINNNDVSDHVMITGTYNTFNPGNYKITLMIADMSGKLLTRNIVLVVKEKETEEETEKETEKETQKKTDKETEKQTEKQTDGADKTTDEQTDGTDKTTDEQTDGTDKATDEQTDGTDKVIEEQTDGTDKVTEEQTDGTDKVTVEQAKETERSDD